MFYAGYLSAEDNKTYLPNIVTSTLKSIVAESDHRQNRMIFKMAVELAVIDRSGHTRFRKVPQPF
ncbi:MAG: hypothetical protein ACLRQR_03935, partial [Merdimonas faecis]